MTNTDGLAREVLARAHAAQRRRQAQIVADRENRHAFLRGYWEGMCRRNCWTYSVPQAQEVRLQVSPRRLGWDALVHMAREAESFRRAQYVHLAAAAQLLAACPSAEHAHPRSWQALGRAFGEGRDLMTDTFQQLPLGELGGVLQRAAREYGPAKLYAEPRLPFVELAQDL